MISQSLFMKLKFRQLFLLGLLPILFSACEETPVPTLILEDAEVFFDTTYVESNVETPQARTVLIEEFTGVQCNNCPDGHATTAQILDDYNPNVILMAIHASSGGFTTPFASSAYDFSIPEADEISTILGTVGYNPAAAINRKQFSDEDFVYMANPSSNPTNWEDHTLLDLGEDTPLNLYIESEWIEADQSLQVDVSIKFTDNYTDGLAISVALTESDIIDTQVDGPAILPNYEHDHVLRDMLTPVQGATLNATYEPGRVFVKSFILENIPDESATPAGINMSNAEIVAFVHRTGTNSEVLHAISAYVE